MDADEKGQAHEASDPERKAALERAKAAAVEAMISDSAVPEWASHEIRDNIRDDWWSDSIWAGLWVPHGNIPGIAEGLDCTYFKDVLEPDREKALLAGATPTEEERRIHRQCFLLDYFDGGHDLPYWEVFEVRAANGVCYLMLSWIGGGPEGVWFEYFEFFREAEEPFRWLRQTGIADRGFPGD